MSDDDVREHALCLGQPFAGIRYAVADASALLDESSVHGADGGGGSGGGGGGSGAGPGDSACAGELTLHGTQVGAGGRRRGEGAAADFHTGDLVRRGAGGQLHFIGRADKQVGPSRVPHLA